MKQPNKITAVVFDLGNVVLRWDVEGILESLHLDEVQTDKLRKHLFGDRVWLDMDSGLLSEAAAIEKVCTQSRLSKTAVEQALLAAKESLVPYNKTIELMQEICDAGIPIYCLSNMSSETYAHIKGYDFFKKFSGIIISGNEGGMKPESRIFRMLLERFDLDPSEILFIDDSLPNIVKARELGINSFHFKGRDACYTAIRESVFPTETRQPV